MTCPRKDIGRAVGYVSLKPTVVAAVLSGSAKGVVHPFPYRAERQRHEGHPSRLWGKHGGRGLTRWSQDTRLLSSFTFDFC